MKYDAWLTKWIFSIEFSFKKKIERKICLIEHIMPYSNKIKRIKLYKDFLLF